MGWYGPGDLILASGNSALQGMIRNLGQLIDNLTNGEYTPADESVTDEKVAVDAAIAQSKIAGLVAALAALVAADSTEATTRAAADTAEAAARSAADGVLTAADAAEVTARAAAVTAEANTRAAADALLIPLTQRGAANGVATLGADSKIPGAQLPSLAIGETFTVASQAAMLALTAQRGDVAVRTDLDPDGFFLLTSDAPGTLADWVQITAPGAVTSVDGLVGAVSLSGVYATIAALASEATARALADTVRIANAQTVDYTLVLADAGKAIEVNSATAKNVTVPPNASVAYPLGTLIEVAQAGVGAVTLVAGASVTFEGGVTTPAQGGSLLLRKLATNNWRVVELAPRGTFVQDLVHTVLVKNANGGGTVDDRAALVAAATQAAALPNGGQVLVAFGTFRVASDWTVPANVELAFAFGGRLKVDAGVTVTINSTGGFKADDHHIFDITAAGAAVVAPQVDEWRARWFGAKGDDSANDSVAIQKTLTTAQTSLRNPNVVLGAGIFRFDTALTYGVANRGFSLIGVAGSTVEQGSANSVSILKWTGGAGAAVTVGGFVSIEGIAFQNFGTADYALKLDATAERPHLKRLSFVPVSGSTPWAIAALWLSNFNYGSIDQCELGVSPAVKITGTGTRFSFTRTVFDAPAGADPMILADCNADVISFNACTFNAETASGTVWDNTASTLAVSVLSFTECEFDRNAGGAGTVIKAKNVKMLRFHANHVSGYSTLAAAFITLTNSRASIKGNTGSSLAQPLVQTLDATSYAHVEQNNLNPVNTKGALDAASQSGSYIPVTIGAEFAASARIHGELSSPMTDTVYIIPVTTASAFSVNVAALADSSSQGFMTPGQRFTVLIHNTSGAAMGAVTWAAQFLLNSTWTVPAAGAWRSISFVWDGTNAREVHRTKGESTELLSVARDVSEATVGATAAETNVFSATIPANTLGTTRLLRLHLDGQTINNNGADQTLTVKVTYGAQTIYNSGAMTLTTSATARPWELDMDLSAAGSAASQRGTTRCIIGAATGNGGVGGAVAVSNVGYKRDATVDSTADQTLAVTVTQSSASGMETRPACIQVFLV